MRSGEFDRWIEASQNCLVICRTNERIVIAWEDILEVTGLNLDCFTVDYVCLDFSLDDGVFRVCEGTPGWPGLLELLPACLKGFPEGEWYSDLCQPPFNGRREILWSKPT